MVAQGGDGRTRHGRFLAASSLLACFVAMALSPPAAAQDQPLVPEPEHAPPPSEPTPTEAAPSGPEGNSVVRVSNERGRTYWSYVRRSVSVRARPDGRSRRTGTLRRRTYHGSVDVALVLELSGTWTRVRYSGLGSRTGWVPTRALSRARLSTSWVVVNRRRKLLRAYQDGRQVLRARVGVGARGSPTPAGRFFIRERLVPSDTNGTYGVLAFGLSAYSRYRTDWPGGGQVGIHGTNQPRLIPGRISNGCIRLRNRDVRRLDRIVGRGTPVRIR